MFLENIFYTDNSSLYCGDCLEVMPVLKEEGVKVDMILADLPYGTTNCKWDTAICLPEMWEQLDGIVYDTTPMLFFSQQPFTTILGGSNLKNLRYNWVWEKTKGTGFLNAKKMPLKCHEEILVFYKKLPAYYPIKTSGHNRKVIKASHKSKCEQVDIYNKVEEFVDYDSTEHYPRSVLKYKSDCQKSALHPTQKPVALLEYFIQTYTKEGDTILDFTMGSGSTGIACQNTSRKFIGIEKDAGIFNTAKIRLTNDSK